MKYKVVFILGIFIFVMGCSSISTKITGQETPAVGVSEDDYDPSFVPVWRALDNMGGRGWNWIIEPGVPLPIKPGIPDSRDNTTLHTAVVPDNATNKTVILSIKNAGSTGATFTGDILNTTGVGTVVITATVPDGLGKSRPFTQDCRIFVAKPSVIKGDWTLRETQSGWILTRYSGREANVTIPADLGVTILVDSFRNNRFVTSVAVPEGVTIIGNEAFFRASNLKSVSLPSTLRIIGNGAFNVCENLMSISIPSGVTEIGDFAFANCKNLTSITIPAGVTTIGTEPFDNSTGLTSITVQAIQPPTFIRVWGGGMGDTPSLTAIYVPSASVDFYKKADVWNRYAELIKGF